MIFNRLPTFLCVLALAATASPANAAVAFTDVTDVAGLFYEHGYTVPLVSEDGAFDEPRHVACGVAAGDYDNDGWVDLYVVRGDIGPNLLFHNQGDGTFAEVGTAAGIALSGKAGAGPTFADIDGDGWLDLFVGGVKGAGLSVFRNRGDGTFEDVSGGTEFANPPRSPFEIGGRSDAPDLIMPRLDSRHGLDGPSFFKGAGRIQSERDTYSATFGDYDRDGDLDLALAHWNVLVADGESSETLWRNDGGFHFTDVSEEAGVTPALRAEAVSFFDFTFTPNFADIDADGLPDLLIAGDFGTTKVLRNQGDGTFVDRTDPGVITDENGMGAAIGDYDNDGDLDWFVSSIRDPDGIAEDHWGVTGNRLYRNRGDGTFEDVTDAAGVRFGFWGWAATWADIDNDGDLDLFHVNGWGRSAEYFSTREFFSDPSRLFVSAGDGTFTEQAAALGADDAGMGRGVVSFDFDRDGDIDFFIANSQGKPTLLRNDGGNEQSYLTVKLRGPVGNSEAIGARIEVVTGASTQMRELRAGSNFESQDPAEAHFGLGQQAVADAVRVRWPDGPVTVLTGVDADQRIVIGAPGAPPTPTATAPEATPTPTIPACVGDCDLNGSVTVDEVIRALNMVLHSLPADACPVVDRNRDGHVTVDEVVAALDRVLAGCPKDIPRLFAEGIFPFSKGDHGGFAKPQRSHFVTELQTQDTRTRDRKPRITASAR